MAWLEKAWARLTGGDAEGLRAAVADAVAQRQWYDVAEIADRFNVSEHAVCAAAEDAVQHALPTLKPEDLTPDGRAAFATLAEALGAPRRTIDNVFAEATRNATLDAITRMYDAGCVDIDRLLTFSGSIGQRQDEVVELLTGFARARLQPLIQTVLQDSLLSPEEDATVAGELRRVGLTALDPQTEALLQEGRDVWQAAAGPLPSLSAPVLLKRGEICRSVVAAEAVEDRQRTVSVTYAGPTARIRIAKGLSYSIGSRSVSRRVESYQHSYGRGVLCTTDKRLLWISPEKTLSFTLPSIVMTEPYRDGLLVRRSSGKPVTFVFDRDDRPAVVLITRVIGSFR